MSGAETKPEVSVEAGPEVLRAGSSFARYEIVRCIGVGGMGAVFEATHTLLRKRVALKTMHTNLGRSEASRARFLREAETVARIRHPNVVDISDLGIEHGIPFLVMDFLEGEDLARFMERRGPLAPQVAVDTVLPIAAGLVAVHRLGIIHRDIKPENVFLARDGHGAVTPKLIDFGVSKDLEASLRGGAAFPHTVTGTPHYMSPEQARGSAALDGRTDQYALGIVIYQALTGRLPYESTSLLELLHLLDTGDFAPIRSLRAEVPAELEAVIHRAMSRHLRDRYPSMAAFGQALLPFASERMRVTHAHEFALQPMSTQETLLALDLSGRQSAATTPAGRMEGLPHEVGSGVRVRDAEAVPSAVPITADVAPHPASQLAPAHHRRRILRWMVLGAVVGAGLLLMIVRSAAPAPDLTSTVTPASSALHLTLRATPSEASFELDGVVIGHGAIDRVLPQDGREHLLQISAPGYEPQTLTIRDRAPDQSSVVLRALPPAVVPPAAASATNDEPPGKRPRPVKPKAVQRQTQDVEVTEPATQPGLDIQLTR